ncbi:MAG TPA: aromatic amino acid ammonia-lyase [Gaiellales bacterium]|jgi:histidine ammonia-lyase
MSAIVLGSRATTIADVVAVARRSAPVTLSAEAVARIGASHQALLDASASGARIYGATTGLGPNVGLSLPADDPDRARRILVGRAAALGPAAPTEVVRAALFARVAGLAAGGSGVSPAVADTLVAMLAAGVHPVVPSIGSVGEADLATLAHLALPLVGLGRAELAGEILEGPEALARAGIELPALSPRDALALCSSNSFAIGSAALAVADALRLLDTANATVALTLEGFAGNPTPTDPRVVAARPFPGHAWAAEAIRSRLEGSSLLEPDGPRQLQDPLPFRCAPVVHGSAWEALERLRSAVELELDAASDNPLVVEGGEVLGSAGFDSTPLSHAIEGASLGLAAVARASAVRTLQLHDGRRTGLPNGLTPVGADRAGMAVLGKPLAALFAQIRSLAMPVSLESLPLALGVEDHASQAPLAAARLGQLLDAFARIIACELACAAQALDLRRGPAPGAGASVLYAHVRRHVAALADDRPIGDEIEALAASIR